jgi:hypothetical protein
MESNGDMLGSGTYRGDVCVAGTRGNKLATLQLQLQLTSYTSRQHPGYNGGPDLGSHIVLCLPLS